MRKWLRRLGFLCILAILALIGLIGYTATFINGRIGVQAAYSTSHLLANPPERLKEPVDLKIVTFNIQDLYIVGQNRPERMRAIGAKLTELDPDIVGFQEAFVYDERQILLDALKDSRLKYSMYYESGTIGSGLLIVSAYPIRETFFHRYTANNDWYRLWEGDWWAGKGMALARIELPGGGYLDLYDTHAQADYGRAANEEVRLSQMQEASHFVLDTRTGTAPTFLLGDFNCRAGEADYEHIVSTLNLTRLLEGRPRIDHVFAMADPAYEYTITGYEEIVEHDGIRLSDHRGYMAKVHIAPTAPEAPATPPAPAPEATPAPEAPVTPPAPAPAPEATPAVEVPVTPPAAG